jgi:uncharacterized protein YutE (UPF0331/DUF86 family)
MTYLVERLVDLRRHLDHLDSLAPRVQDATSLERDQSLHNDVLFSLLMVARLVIDIAGELSARRGDRFDDDLSAIRNLGKDERFPAQLVRDLERLPGFRNIIVHEYAALDLTRAVAALHALQPVRRFLTIVAGVEHA